MPFRAEHAGHSGTQPHVHPERRKAPPSISESCLRETKSEESRRGVPRAGAESNESADGAAGGAAGGAAKGIGGGGNEGDPPPPGDPPSSDHGGAGGRQMLR